MPVMLPDEVQQQLGFLPSPVAPQQFQPDVAALTPTVDNPPQFTQLSAPPQLPQQPAPSQDFHIPVEAIAPRTQQPAPPSVRAAAPQHPPSIDQQMANSHDRQNVADQASLTAVDSQETVDRARAADELAAYGAHEKQAKTLEDESKVRQETYAKTHAAKQTYAQAMMAKADNYKVDQNKYEKEMGVGDHIRWGIGMILSGVGQAMQHQGGPNPVLQMLQDKMHQSVVQQMDERDQLRGRASNAAHDLDKYDEYSKSREATMALLDAKNDRQLANMLTQSAAKYKDAQAQVNAQKSAAELLQSSAKKVEESTQFAANYDMKKKDQDISRGQLGVSQFNAGESKRHNLVTEEMAQQGKDMEALKLERAGQADQAKLVRERSIGGEVHEVKDANGKVIGSELGAIRMKDGSVFIPKGGPEDYSRLTKAHNATLKLDATLAEIQRLGPEWLSDASNSAKKQKLDQLGTTAKLEAIQALDLGVPTGNDVALATGFVGTTDPTRFRDSTAGIAQARKTLNTAHNVQLHTAGLDKDWESPNLTAIPKAPATAVERIATTLKAEPDANPERARTAAFADAYKSSGGDIKAAHAAAIEAADAARSGRISPVQRKGIESLKATALAGGEDAQAAIAALEDVVLSKDEEFARKPTGILGVRHPWDKNGNPVRNLAEAALSEIRSASEPSEPTTSPGPTYDPNAYDPQSLINRFQRVPEPTILPRPVAAQ